MDPELVSIGLVLFTAAWYTRQLRALRFRGADDFSGPPEQRETASRDE